MRCYCRVIVSVALTTMALFLTVGHALAAVEYCPAAVTLRPLGASDTASRFSAVFYGGSPRLVSGYVAVRSDRDWFLFPFNDERLEPTAKTYRDDAGTFSISEYQSPTLFVRFPRDIRVRYAYVNIGKGVNDASFVWDSKGLVSCQSADDRRIVATSANPGEPLSAAIEDMNPRAIPASIPSGSRVATAIVARAPGATNCAKPFADATVSQQVVPPLAAYSGGKSGQTIVAVALDAQGHVGDAWTWRSSGLSGLDAVAVAAARQSLYTPKRAFCQGVPGVYYLVDDFKGK